MVLVLKMLLTSIFSFVIIAQLLTIRTPGSTEAGSEPSCKQLHGNTFKLKLADQLYLGEDPFSAKYAQAEHHRLEDCRVIIPPQVGGLVHSFRKHFMFP